MNHEFFLLDDDFLNYSQLLDSAQKQEPILIQDDFLRYIYDTIRWIPTFNPVKRQIRCGLDLCGVTVIDARGASKAEAIFEKWASLMEEGPSLLELTGSYAWIEGDESQAGFYERLKIKQNLLVKNLKIIAGYASQVHDNRKIILHLGL